MKKFMKLNAENEAEHGGSGLPNKLEHRISALVDMFETRTKAAEIAGISTDQLARYTSGKSQPAFVPIAKMAQAMGVSLEWIWTGEGPMLAAERVAGPGPSSAINRKLLQDCLEAVDQVLEEADRYLPPDKKAELILALYDLFEETGKVPDRKVILRLVKSAA